MDHLLTETRNPNSMHLDEMTALEIVRLMNAEDAQIATAVGGQAEAIARAIDVIAERFEAGGRLIYLGAGTSGRLGVLDASECPPTFNSPPGQVVGVIAGGSRALTQAIEGAEDHPESAVTDLQALSLRSNDVLVGIATSGRTPYVLGGLDYARSLGAFTIGLACTASAELSAHSELPLEILVGPEVLTGSTRLKAGTATKLVLNMLTTGAMVRTGKALGNLMVDLRATNEKLRARTNRIVRQLTGISHKDADALLATCDGELKTALLSQLGGLSPLESRAKLKAVGGRVTAALQDISRSPTLRPVAADLILGIDGGGSRTRALLARRTPDTTPGWKVLGVGEAGPSNLNTAGKKAFLALDTAIRDAFSAAQLTRQTVSAASLGLAGMDRPTERAAVLSWARDIALAESLDLTNDATLLLATGTPEGWGLAVVAGTGSIAVAIDAQGIARRAGGWGPLLGDEGSGYAIVLAGLQAVAKFADNRGPATSLTERFQSAFGVANAHAMIPKIYALDRAALASFAHVVLTASDDGDAVARQIVEHAAMELAHIASTACQHTFGPAASIPIALAGGMFTAFPTYRALFQQTLANRHPSCASFTLVADPAEGALHRAATRAAPLR